MPTKLATFASEIKHAQDHSTQIEPFTARAAGFDIADGYAVGALVHRARVDTGDRPVGRKLGMTNRERWPTLGVSEPIWSWLRAPSVTRFDDGRARVSLERFLEPKIEPEIVVHFRDAPPDGATVADIVAAIDWVAPGFEIVHTHYPGWCGKPADSLADCAHHAALLVGEPVPVARFGALLAAQMAGFSVSLYCADALRETARGTQVLGSPLEALVALVALARRHGAPLAAGELVTTGTITAAYPVLAGEHWRADFAGIALPTLSVSFD